jgi:hypothetical protein
MHTQPLHSHCRCCCCCRSNAKCKSLPGIRPSWSQSASWRRVWRYVAGVCCSRYTVNKVCAQQLTHSGCCGSRDRWAAPAAKTCKATSIHATRWTTLHAGLSCCALVMHTLCCGLPNSCAVSQAEVKRRTEADRQIQSHFDSEVKALQVRMRARALAPVLPLYTKHMVRNAVSHTSTPHGLATFAHWPSCFWWVISRTDSTPLTVLCWGFCCRPAGATGQQLR